MESGAYRSPSVTGANGRSRRRPALAGGALTVVVIATAACESSRDEPESAPARAETVVVDLPPPTADIEPDGDVERESDEPSTTNPDSSRPTLNVPFADYFDVDPFGTAPVRGSGCGLDTPIGAELPDGLWRGYVRSFDGLWVDAASSLQFDLACVYAGDAAAEAEQEWREDHPGQEPVDVRDGFLVNNKDRERTVPLARSFVQVDGQWNDAGQCAVPETLPPSGDTEAYRLLDSWMLVTGGEAQWVVTSCPPES